MATIQIVIKKREKGVINRFVENVARFVAQAGVNNTVDSEKQSCEFLTMNREFLLEISMYLFAIPFYY